MPDLIFITHPEVVVDATRPVPQWPLNPRGRARAQAFATSGVLAAVQRLWASDERKAQDTATILGAALNLPVETDPRLGENDRSATGFLPPDAFEAAADRFFAEPETSFRGWETARAAQDRIVRAVREKTQDHRNGDIAIVAHGAVGTLLYCHLMGLQIDRRYDQPHQGHYWTAPLPEARPRHGWRSIG